MVLCFYIYVDRFPKELSLQEQNLNSYAHWGGCLILNQTIEPCSLVLLWLGLVSPVLSGCKTGIWGKLYLHKTCFPEHLRVVLFLNFKPTFSTKLLTQGLGFPTLSQLSSVWCLPGNIHFNSQAYESLKTNHINGTSLGETVAPIIKKDACEIGVYCFHSTQ